MIQSWINTIQCGKNLELLKKMPDECVHAIVCDPPYGWKFMGKKWDYDVPTVQFWQEAMRVLKCGGHMIVACGTRTQHRMAVNIEDAGFEIRDVISWIYGSGFPKSGNIGKDIDEILGNERNTIEVPKHMQRPNAQKNRSGNKTGNFAMMQNTHTTKGNSEWEGWGTALKPSMELWTLCRKPISEKTIAHNILKHSAGAMNIDACRVPFVSENDYAETTNKNQHENFGTEPITNNTVYGDYSMVRPKNYEASGRFPANVLHDGTEDVLNLFNNIEKQLENNPARFFYCAKPSAEEKNAGLGGLQRNTHPTVKPIELMRYFCRLITPPNGIVLDPFAGSGTTLIAAEIEDLKWIGMDDEVEYIPIIKQRISFWETHKHKYKTSGNIPQPPQEEINQIKMF